MLLNFSASESHKGRVELVLLACIGQVSFNICPCSPVIGAKIERLILFLLIWKKCTIPVIW